jgi:hypothetical protein
VSWLEPAGKEHALRFAEYRNGKWSQPRTIVQRGDFFVNWADFPSITRGADGTLYAHWLQKSGSDTYAYDVRVARSRDDGKTWDESLVIHRDRKPVEHGFASVTPRGKGVDLVWIDNGTIHHASLESTGGPKNEVELDAKSCECCATGMTVTSKGPLVVFRDRLEGEVRDISITRFVGGKWTAPRLVHGDGWVINGCPVNGPQADAIGERVAVAWYTGAAPRPRVQLAWSNDAGATFTNPALIDDGKPLGRVDVVLVDKNTALVTWLEQTANGAEIRARRVTRNGAKADSVKVAESGAGRNSGVPRIARIGSRVYAAFRGDKGITIAAIE